LDGKFEIDSAVGKGTRLNITVPLLPEEGVSNWKAPCFSESKHKWENITERIVIYQAIWR